MIPHPRPIGEKPLLAALLVSLVILTRDLLAGMCLCVLALVVFWWMQI
jgi:hypothetical protein